MQMPHQQGSTPRLPPWQPRQTTCGDLLVLRLDTKRQRSPAPLQAEKSSGELKTPPPRHQGRPGGAERATAAPTRGGMPYTRRKPRKSRRRHSLRPSEQRTAGEPRTAPDPAMRSGSPTPTSRQRAGRPTSTLQITSAPHLRHL
jgi:hypothetical protein